MNVTSMVTGLFNMSMLQTYFLQGGAKNLLCHPPSNLPTAGRLRSRYLVDGGDLACETLSCYNCFFSLFVKQLPAV